MRVHLKGINSHTAKLADGTTKTYWYAWKGGPRLQGEPGTPEFIASYNEAAAQKIRAPTGLLFSLLQAYQASEDFRQLAQRTRDDYRRIIQRERSRRNIPISPCLLLPTNARAESLWSGAIGWLLGRGVRLTTRGQFLRVCCHGRRIAARSPSIPANVVVVFTADRAQRMSGARSRKRCRFRHVGRSGRSRGLGRDPRGRWLRRVSR